MTDTSQAAAGTAPGQQAAAGDQAAAAAAAQQQAPNPAQVAAQAQQQAAQQQATQGQQGQPQGGAPWENPDTARAEIERLRREAGDQRINAKNQAREDGMRQAAIAFAKAAGIEVPGGEEVTVESLTARLNEEQQGKQKLEEQGTASQRELLAVTEAWKAGVNPQKLDYLRFLLGQDATYSSITPSEADAGAKVASIIAAQVANDPTLKAAGTAAASGAEGYGGAGAPSEITQEQFNAMPLDKRTELYHSDRATYDRLTGRA